MTTPAPPVVPKPKIGLKTSELYVTLAPAVLTVMTLIFHRDFSGYVQAAALVATGLSAAAYAVSRAHLKRPVDLASALYDLRALLPVGKDAAAVVAEVKAATPKATKAAPKAAPPVDAKQAGHADVTLLLLVGTFLGVVLLLFGVTFR